jgi:20S proteasome subunit alpha 7
VAYSSGSAFTLEPRCHSIYLVHDDAKDKEFELEMSWIGDETEGRHLAVPNDLKEEAERRAKEAIEQFEDEV